MTEQNQHSIAEIRDSLICGCDPQIFSAGDHGDDCPIILFDGLVEQQEVLRVGYDNYLAERNMWRERANGLQEQQEVYEENLKAYQRTILDLKEQLEAYRVALDKIANTAGTSDNYDERLIAHRALSNPAISPDETLHMEDCGLPGDHAGLCVPSNQDSERENA